MTNQTQADDEQESCYRCGEPASLRAAGSDNVFRPFCRECFEDGHESTSDTLWALLGAALLAAGGLAIGEGATAVLVIAVVYCVGALMSWWTFFGVAVSMRP